MPLDKEGGGPFEGPALLQTLQLWPLPRDLPPFTSSIYSSRCPALENRCHLAGRDSTLLHSTLKQTYHLTKHSPPNGFNHATQNSTTPFRKCGSLAEPWKSLIDERVKPALSSNLLLSLDKHINKIFQSIYGDTLDTGDLSFTIFEG